MEDYQLLIDLHKDADRQGPGGHAETKKAMELAMGSNRKKLVGSRAIAIYLPKANMNSKQVR